MLVRGNKLQPSRNRLQSWFIYQHYYENTLTVINIIKNLIKNKVHIYELAHSLSTKQETHCETLINESQACSKNIKSKIKEKSEVTIKIREQLTEQQRQELKVKVAEGGTYERKTFLSSFTPHSKYHQLVWLNVLSEYSGYEIYLFMLKVDEKVVAGMAVLLIKSKLFGCRMISIPCVNCGGVLFYSKKLSESLLCNIKDWTTANSIKYTEIRTTIRGLTFRSNIASFP